MSLATALRELHVPGTPLVVPNAWDAASAQLVEAAGFAAVATSSNATAAVLGYDDGEHAPVDDVLTAAARIARAVSVPVTVDFERGYRLDPASSWSVSSLPAPSGSTSRTPIRRPASWSIRPSRRTSWRPSGPLPVTRW